MLKVRLRATPKPVGAAKLMLESAPSVALKKPERVSPPVEVKVTPKEVLPSCEVARVFLGSTVKVQPSPDELRVTVSLEVSTLTASEQVTVYREVSLT